MGHSKLALELGSKQEQVLDSKLVLELGSIQEQELGSRLVLVHSKQAHSTSS